VTTTVTGTGPVVTVNPALWRTSVANNDRYLSPWLAAIPDSIRHLRSNYGVTEDSLNLLELTNELESMSSYCSTFHNFSVEGAPTSALATDAASVSSACNELVAIDRVDLASSKNRWTPKLASNDRHWLKILQERVIVLKNAAAN
jgi:hypothetical protein